MTVVVLPGATVRARLARAAFGLPCALPDAPLGSVRLHRHQRIAAARLRRALDVAGGALLADDVGLGKTFTALAVARDARAPVAVVPAALREHWRRALAAAGVHATVCSLESLSRPTLAAATRDALAGADLVVVDEAHHLRNPATRRWRRLADLTARARILLLTATPIHNAPRELLALLSLALGARAAALDPAARARLVVRRTRTPTRDGAPRVARTRWHRIDDRIDDHGDDHGDDRALLDAILALPPPLAPRDGGTAPTLAAMLLVRLWASSDAALRAALRRRLARAAALAHALDHARPLPDARTLARDACHPDAVQFGLPLDGDAPPSAARTDARTRLSAHAAALRALLARLDAHAARRDPDARRADVLRALRAAHPDVPIVAFTQFADTARAMYRRLAHDGGVAMLTAAGGRIASGTVSRREVLVRFAPLASGVPPL